MSIKSKSSCEWEEFMLVWVMLMFNSDLQLVLFCSLFSSWNEFWFLKVWMSSAVLNCEQEVNHRRSNSKIWLIQIGRCVAALFSKFGTQIWYAVQQAKSTRFSIFTAIPWYRGATCPVSRSSGMSSDRYIVTEKSQESDPSKNPLFILCHKSPSWLPRRKLSNLPRLQEMNLIAFWALWKKKTRLRLFQFQKVSFVVETASLCQSISIWFLLFLLCS